MSAALALQRLDHLVEFPQLVHDGRAVVEKLPAGLREMDLLASFSNSGNPAGGVFELAHQQRNGGLAQTQFVGRARATQMTSHGFEDTQSTKCHMHKF